MLKFKIGSNKKISVKNYLHLKLKRRGQYEGKRNCCKYQSFMEVEVNQKSATTFQKILESLEYGFLVVIAEYTKEFPERKITVFCNETKAKDDEFTVIKKNHTELYCVINLSKATVQHLNKKKRTN